MTSEDGELSSILRHVSVNVYSDQACREVYKDLYPIKDDMFLCAGTEEGGRDACDSDSGAPLFIGDTIVAITGDGIGCARPGKPSTNARISTYADWIERSICSLSSVPPPMCAKRRNEGPWGITSILMGVIFISGLFTGFVISGSSRTGKWKLFPGWRFSYSGDDDYEEIPGVDMAERGTH
jgi:hypothetical protein